MNSRSHKYKCAWGAFVRFLLEKNGLSEADLASRLRIAPGQVNQYINGRSKPPIGELSAWAEALRCTGDEAERLSWLALEPWTPAMVWAKIRRLEDSLRDHEATAMALARELADLRSQPGEGDPKPVAARK